MVKLLPAILCIGHAVAASWYALRELHGIGISVPLLFILIVTWFIWPFVIQKSGARKERYFVPVLFGFVLLFPAIFYLLLDVVPWRM